MAITHVGNSGTAAGSSNNGTLGPVTLPSGWAVGDLGILLVYLDQGTVNTPSGWANISGSPFIGATSLYVMTRIMETGDTAPSMTVSGSATNMSNVAAIMCYRATGTVEAIGTVTDSTGTPCTNGGVTSSTDGAMIVSLLGRGDNDQTWGTPTFNASSTGVTRRGDGLSTSQGSDSELQYFDLVKATAGASGTASITAATTDPYQSISIALRPRTRVTLGTAAETDTGPALTRRKTAKLKVAEERSRPGGAPGYLGEQRLAAALIQWHPTTTSATVTDTAPPAPDVTGSWSATGLGVVTGPYSSKSPSTDLEYGVDGKTGGGNNALEGTISRTPDAVSIEGWLRWDATPGGYQALLQLGDAVSLSCTRLIWQPNQLALYSHGGGGGSSSFTPTLGTWYHLAVTHNRLTGEMVAYKDGSQIISQGGLTCSDTQGTVSFGKAGWGSQEFDGALAGLAYYERILSPAEVALRMTVTYSPTLTRGLPPTVVNLGTATETDAAPSGLAVKRSRALATASEVDRVANLVAGTDGTFESGAVPNWYADAYVGLTTLAAQTGWANSGAYSLRLTVTDTNGTPRVNGARTPQNLSGYPVVGGKVYDLTVRANVLNDAAGALVQIYWYDSAGTYITGIASSPVTGTGVKTLSRNATAPANAAYASVGVYGSVGGATTTFDSYFDDVLLIPQASLVARKARTLGTAAETDSAARASTDAYMAAVLTDAPVGYWRLDEASGTTALDVIGTQNGTHVGSVTSGATEILPAGHGYAASYPGGTGAATTTSVYTGWGSDTTKIISWSFEAIVKTTDTSNLAAVMGALKTGTTMLVQVELNSVLGALSAGSNSIEVMLRNNSGSTTRGRVTSSALFDGNPHHLAVVMESATTFSVYVDGTSLSVTYDQQNFSTASIADFDYAWAFGNRNARGTYDHGFNGTLDDVALYHTRLSSSRVTAHYNAAGFSKRVNLGTAAETDTGPALTRRKTRALTTAAEVDTAATGGTGAAASYRDAQPASHTTSATWTVPTLPTGWQIGDYCLLYLFADVNTNTVSTPPAGWDLLYGPTDNSGTADVRGWCYGRRLQSGDTAPEIVFTGTQAGGSIIAAYSGANLTTAVDAGTATGHTTGTVHTTTAIDTTVANTRVIVAVGSDESATFTPYFSAWDNSATERVDSERANFVEVGLADYTVASPGSTTGGWTQADSDAPVSFIVALRPAAGATLGRRKTVNLGPAAETDSAGSLTRVKTRALTTAAETDSAGALTRTHAYALTSSAETDSAGALTSRHTYALTSSAETDSAGALTSRHTYTLATAAETDAAGSVTESAGILVNLTTAAESDAAGALTRVKTRALTTAAETDSAFALTKIDTIRVELTSSAETDSAGSIATRVKTRTVSTATETDSAFALTKIDTIRVELQTAAETDTAAALTSRKTYALTSSAETDTAQPLTKIDAIRVELATAAETDAAGSVTLTGRITVYLATATETDATFALTKIDTIRVELATAAETDAAGSIATRRKTATLQTAAETDSAGALQARKTRELAVAAETDSAGNLTALRYVNLEPALETDSAGALARVKVYRVGVATELDTAIGLTLYDAAAPYLAAGRPERSPSSTGSARGKFEATGTTAGPAATGRPTP